MIFGAPLSVQPTLRLKFNLGRKSMNKVTLSVIKADVGSLGCPYSRRAASAADTSAVSTVPRSSLFAGFVVIQHWRLPAEEPQIRIQLPAVMPVPVVREVEVCPGRIRPEW